MKKIKTKYLFLSLISTLFCLTNSSAQELLYEVPLNEQIQNSSQIIEGKVLSKTSFWDANQYNIYTVNTIEVYKVFKGQTLTTIEVITEGGTVGYDIEIVNPSLQLAKGDIGVFLLNNNSLELSSVSAITTFESNSSSQGFYKYNIQDNIASNPFGIKNGIASELYSEITAYTNTNYTNVSSFDLNTEMDVLNSRRGGIAINSFSPTTITAGTKSILTIDGAGFGSPGTVEFRDANDGGASFYAALDSQIISWTPTQIQVEVPSRAGTGTIRIFDSIGFNVTSSSVLTISYAEINAETDTFTPGTVVAYQTQHVDDNGSGGYTWQMFTGFNNNAAANQSFVRAFDSWVCETGVNWDIGTPTSTDVVADDDINIIRLDNGSELPNGVLGRCTSRFSGCSSGPNGFIFVTELDIVFDDGINWQFGPGLPSFSQYDFESVAVHELGHGHQLTHVIDNNAIMHYAISNGEFNRELSANDIAGGNDVQSRSTAIAVCGEGLMTNSACSLSVADNFLSENLTIYPIPTKDQLYIKRSSNLNLNDAYIYDIRGQLISKIDVSQSSNLKTIDVSQLSSGMYFINIHSDNASMTRKFIIE
jgi:hypothetical protein